MNRRLFFRNSFFIASGSLVSSTFANCSQHLSEVNNNKTTARNIIFLVSDGMSSGTLSMADQYLYRNTGKRSNWMKLYQESIVSRSLMETSSASSIITDSAAASSAWGGGVKVPNGSINMNANGTTNTPILQKFKQKGKKVGCVTTVPITHATPAGFCVATKYRDEQAEIAKLYLPLGFDVMMGGGANYFSPLTRGDKQDLFQAYRSANWQVARNKKEMLQAEDKQPVLGVFANNTLPYSLDHVNDKSLLENVPTLAEMTQTAIQLMNTNKKGFALQVEGGKVDWAAHGNDIGGLIKDQIAFDEAIKVAIDFAKKDGNTLVIITTDHGNANPGILYGHDADKNFDSIANYRQSNEWVLNGIDLNTPIQTIIERVEYANPGLVLDSLEASLLQSYYAGLTTEYGLYNPRKLPFKFLAEIQKSHNSIGWISMDHTSDHVELAAYGPGSQFLPGFVVNTDLHGFMLEVGA